MPIANAALISDQQIDLSIHGIDCVTWEQASDYLTTSSPSVLGVHIPTTGFIAGSDLLVHEKMKNQKRHFVVFHDDLSAEQIAQLHMLARPTQIHCFSKELPLHDIFAQCFDKYYNQEQSEKLVQLVNEKNEELKKLTIELENKVNLRQEQLEESIQKNTDAQKKLESLKKALVQIYQAQSVREMEHGLTHVLKEEFQISWITIRGQSQSNLSDQNNEYKLYKVPLKSGLENFGHLLFYKNKKSKFDQKEKRFLSQVADAVSLSIQRTYQYDKSQELKRQWEATFDAISDPICLTDKDYNILRINASFLKKTATTDYKQHIGQKCYASLFKLSQPCQGCLRGQTFQIRNIGRSRNSEIFEVYSNDLGDKEQSLYFQKYRDVTQDLNLQRQVIESAKMAELGTISSSIAHELNNPIGGMLNFIQLMKMDLTGDENFFDDLIEIEKGIVKCKNIVKSLLGFSRKSFHADVQAVSLNEVIEQAIKITELKTRSIGIQIHYEAESENMEIAGRFNLLTHAIRNILQNSQESLIERRRTDKSFQGIIEIKLQQGHDFFEILICDNGLGIAKDHEGKIFDPLYTTKDPETNSGLGLTLALQIVKEHFGTIEVSSRKDKKLCFKIRFSKSQVQSG